MKPSGTQTQVGRAIPCPPQASPTPNGAHGVTRPTVFVGRAKLPLCRGMGKAEQQLRPTLIAFCLLLLLGSLKAYADSEAHADSGDFVLNTTGYSTSVTGPASADSGDFVLNTTGYSTSVTSSASADSGDFVLNTTGYSTSVAGSASADSADFILNTLNVLDIGLGAFDGTAIIKFAAEAGPPLSPLRINKNGTLYSILLVDPADPSASKFRIRTATSTKSLQKLP